MKASIILSIIFVLIFMYLTVFKLGRMTSDINLIKDDMEYIEKQLNCTSGRLKHLIELLNKNKE